MDEDKVFCRGVGCNKVVHPGTKDCKTSKWDYENVEYLCNRCYEKREEYFKKEKYRLKCLKEEEIRLNKTKKAEEKEKQRMKGQTKLFS